ncbi:MAG: hypothetical protein DI570_23080 [Phenylobacterium zucineum]|nr:MAG: hypothetical protein DI570_23080 [Phenylobacterium zucineum]
MLRRALTSALILALAASPVLAADSKKEGEKGDVGQYVDLQPVGVPIMHERRLVNYIFVYVRINLTSRADVSKLREKEPFFRDALIRAAHRTPFTDPKDLTKVNAPMLSAALVRDATAIAGAGQIISVVVTDQAPRRRFGMPKAS